MPREQITVNFFDETGEDAVSEFISKDSITIDEKIEFFKEATKKEFITDQDFAEVFTKVAEEYNPKNWSELKEKVSTLFSGKADAHFDR
jgi:formyltetrahydrofolate hydrolase